MRKRFQENCKHDATNHFVFNKLKLFQISHKSMKKTGTLLSVNGSLSQRLHTETGKNLITPPLASDDRNILMRNKRSLRKKGKNGKLFAENHR